MGSSSPWRRFVAAAVCGALLGACGEAGTPTADETGGGWPAKDAGAPDARPDGLDGAAPDGWAEDANADAESDAAAEPDADSEALDAEAGDAAAPPDARVDGPAPDPPLAAPQGPWGPAARVTTLAVPAGPDEARADGCLVFGHNVGSGLHNLVLLAGGIDRYLRPDARGRIQIVLLLHAAGWAAGVPVGALDRIELAMLPGAQDAEGRFLIARSAFVDGDPANPPGSRFPDTRVEDGGWLDAPAGRIPLPVPAPGGLVLDVPVSSARITGRLFVDGPGFGVADGLITGYITDDTLLDTVVRVRALCAAENAPGVCALVGGAIEGRSDVEIRDLLVGQAGGFDAHVDPGGHPYPCDDERGPACNAVSVCLKFAAEGVVIEGVAPP